MVQEEETQKRCNNNSGSGGGFNMGNTGRSCKKQKQKKVPQRGLGVAQLEKIRLEEQQKKYGSVILPSPPAVSPTRPSNFSVPLPNYQSYSFSIAHPPDVSSPDSRLRPQNGDVVSPNTIPLVNSIGLGWQSVPAPKMLNSCQYTLERESFGVDTGLPFRSSSNFVCESNPIYPLPGPLQKPQRHQQPSPSSSSSSSSLPSPTPTNC
uniref:Uncharacterized protein n=1 Tax=Rhizophora mucronata TaxID=61149 RepID=A0A2P2J9Y3_RHIMU